MTRLATGPSHCTLLHPSSGCRGCVSAQLAVFLLLPPGPQVSLDTRSMTQPSLSPSSMRPEPPPKSLRSKSTGRRVKTPSLHVPSPGVREPGLSPLQNWPQGPRDGPRRSGLLVLTGPLGDGRSQAVDAALAALLPRMARPTRGTGHRERQARRQAGREGGLREPGPPSAPSPHPLCLVPLPPGAGKPRSSHRRENRATK